MMKVEEIEQIKNKALRGKDIDKADLVRLLELTPGSEEAEILGKAASEVAQISSQGKARLWGAIGVDYKACDMNCRFCSLGAKWGIVKEEKEYDIEEIIRQVKFYVKQDFHYILLRTTEFFSVEKLGEYIRQIRNEVPGDFELGCNIGELDEEKTEFLYQCGGRIAYHCLRLREGIDTEFKIEDRVHTLEAIRDSKMKLGFWVEPVGPEHTNEELAEKILQTIEYGTDVCGVMARVPVKGTPFGESGQVSDERLAQITAVLRMAGGTRVKDICTHPASEIAVRYGANVLTLETGAIPRDAEFSGGSWNGLHVKDARSWLNQNGYHIEQ